MKNFWYMFSAYAVIWVLVGGYVFKLGSKLSSLEKKLESANEAD